MLQDIEARFLRVMFDKIIATRYGSATPMLSGRLLRLTCLNVGPGPLQERCVLIASSLLKPLTEHRCPRSAKQWYASWYTAMRTATGARKMSQVLNEFRD
jgi:hypothetical protein